MTQSSLTLPTSGTLPGLNLVSGVNDALATLASQNGGATAPTTTQPNLAWMDTARHVLNFRDEADSAWIPAIGFDQTAKTALLSAELPTLAALRAAPTPWPGVRISGHTTAGDGGEGFFRYDPSDTTSADNNGTVIVNPATGWRYHRSLAGILVTPAMFGARGDTRTVTDGAMSAGGAALTSATAGFTAADVGKAVSVLGAGPSGGALNATVAAVASATTIALSVAAATTVTAAGISLGSDDTAALQAWAAILLAGNPGLWNAGRFKITAPLVLMPAGSNGVIPEFTTAGTAQTVLDGWALTSGQAALFLGAGNSQSKTQVARWNMGIDLGAISNGSDGVQVNGVDWLAIYGMHVRSATYGLHLINNATGQYTEGVVGHDWSFDGVATAIFYDNQTGGTNSFRSSGLVGFQDVNGSGAFCIIGNGATPYFSPLKGTMWGSRNGVFIQNNATFTDLNFDFELTLESADALALGAGQYFWLRGAPPIVAGPAVPSVNSGTSVTRGAAILVEELVMTNTGGQIGVARPYKVVGPATTTSGETIAIPTASFFANSEETGIELFVHISGPGTPYTASILVKCASAGGIVNGSVETMAVNDQSGYGWPTFAVSGSNLTFVYSSAPWPAGMTYSYTVRQTRSLFT